MSSARLITAALPVVLAGCTDPRGYLCALDEQCGSPGSGARCEAGGNCSFADTTCPSGRRYGGLAGDGLAGACVGVPDGGAGADADLAADGTGAPDAGGCAEGDGQCPDGCTALDDLDCADCHVPSTWPAPWSEFEVGVVTRVNEQRQLGGSCVSGSYPPSTPVIMETEARVAARCHALDMARNDTMGALGSDGSSPEERLAAENSALDFMVEIDSVGWLTPEAAVDSWLSGDGCAAVLSPSIRAVGMGFVSRPSTARGTFMTYDAGSL